MFGFLFWQCCGCVVAVQAVGGANANSYLAVNCRKHTFSLTEFGGVGDGKTLNTAAFGKATAQLSQYASDGGSLLIVPAGEWLTGPFNLTSNFTLYLDKGAVILASQNVKDYQLIAALPSYGRGRDAPGGRFISLIFGTNLTDVVITGENGVIDGQGQLWWKMFQNNELKNTRPYLIEIMHSNHIQLSNLKLVNSPSWNVHPVYSSDIIIEHLTISAPVDSPNTDGINPDSCSNVRIWDNCIQSGDDCVAIKSGWDEYGVKVNMPSRHISIKRLTCVSPTSATVAVGSEMSGGVEDVRAEDITAINTQSGIRVKTSPGRGGYVKDIYLRNATFLEWMKYVFWVTAEYGDHPDDGFNPNAIPKVTGLSFTNIMAQNVTYAGKLVGPEAAPFADICISNATIAMHIDDGKKHKNKKEPWNCTDIAGKWSFVTPQPCSRLVKMPSLECGFPSDRLPIENVQLQSCPLSGIK
ncbi:unnamed protein product [Cuscuta europaea]|uniref:Polygalacturonase n=1 Tax=Cuscuta europaea TaxID=41803 RepID=A0A9P0ZTL5_CUSEU|nr:unnamed protein product [Cuscuta europaea]